MKKVTLWEARETDGGGMSSKVIGLFEHSDEAQQWKGNDPFHSISSVSYLELDIEDGRHQLRLLFPLDTDLPVPETVVVHNSLPVYNSMAHYIEATERTLVARALEKLNPQEVNALRKHLK